MIKLTNINDCDIWLNPASIEAMYYENLYTTILLGAGNKCIVKETPEQILSMINKYIPEDEDD